MHSYDEYVVWLTFTKYTCYRDGIKDVSVTLVPLSYEKGDNNINDTKKVSENGVCVFVL